MERNRESSSQPSQTAPPNRLAEPALLWFLMLIGAIPVVGYAIGGSWYPGEVGVGTVFMLFAAWQLAHEAYLKRSRHHRHRHQHAGHGSGRPPGPS